MCRLSRLKVQYIYLVEYLKIIDKVKNTIKTYKKIESVLLAISLYELMKKNWLLKCVTNMIFFDRKTSIVTNFLRVEN